MTDPTETTCSSYDCKEQICRGQHAMLLPIIVPTSSYLVSIFARSYMYLIMDILCL